jgi:homoserine dehydrogenase
MRPISARVRYRPAPVSEDSPIRIGLLGFGTVGSAVHRLLTESADSIRRVTGRRVEVAAALVRDPSRRAGAPEGLLTSDFARLRDDDSVPVVAEVMGGIDPTRQYVLDLLRAGKSVVSANKQLLSRHGDELFGEAERNGVQLRFEASVCAAIPVVKVLRESMIVTNVHRIDGIVNGTTNFILTQMIQRGAPYADALGEAQRLGYAEADPTEDVTGADAAAKIAILASIAFHTRIRLEEVGHVGIDRLDLADVEHAAELGYAVKLIASARQLNGEVAARVHPCLLHTAHPLAGVEGAFNAVMLGGRSIREVILEGPGAGGEETATAVIGDLIAVIGTQGTGFLQHDVYFREVGRFHPDLLESPCYLRVTVDDTPGVLAQVAQQLADHDVSVAQVVQHPSDEGVHIVILTHRAREGDVRAAAENIAGLPFSRSSPVMIPVLERG